MDRFLVLLMALAVTIAGCENSGSQQSAGDAGSASRDTDHSPKADWGNEDGVDVSDGSVAVDGTVDGSSDGVITDGSDSSDANDGSDATDGSDVIDCSVPPDDCDFIDGQALICDEITGQPEEVWSFWNPKTCAWDLNTETWPNPDRVVVGDIPSHEAQSYIDVLECKVL